VGRQREKKKGRDAEILLAMTRERTKNALKLRLKLDRSLYKEERKGGSGLFEGSGGGIGGGGFFGDPGLEGGGIGV